VTGAGHLDIQSVVDRLGVIRRYTDMPVGVGFGISDARSAVAVAASADAVVIGSALIRVMEDAQRAGHDPMSKAAEFLSGIRAALDQMPAKISEAA